MTENDTATTGLTRRRVVQGAAWTVPVIAVSAAAPAFATSPVKPRFEDLEVCKLPGKSNDAADFGYLFRVPYTGTLEQFNIDSVNLNGKVFTAECKKSVQTATQNYYEWVVKSSNSADGSGTAIFTYTFLGVTETTDALQYDGTKPCKGDTSGVCR